eukprot:2397441-Prymnesium_polylepis.1
MTPPRIRGPGQSWTSRAAIHGSGALHTEQDVTGLGILWHRSTTNLCRKIRSAVAIANPRAVWRAPGRRERRRGDVPTAASSSSARGSAGR